MKIALLTDGIYPYVMGGMQKHSYFLAKYLSRAGVQVEIVHCVMHDQQLIDILTEFTEEELKNISHTCIHFPASSGYVGHYLRESYIYSEKVYNAIKGRLGSFDFIYIKGFSGWKLLEEKKKGLKCPPVGIKFHGLNMYQKPPSFIGWLQNLMLRPFVRMNLNAADYAFSYGGKITEILLDRVSMPPYKIIEVPTGIEQRLISDKHNASTAVRKFVFVGRYERLKALEELYEAIKMIAGKYQFEFHIIGPLEENKKLNLPMIKYWGAITKQEELLKLISGFDVLVCPSYSEGMPNVVIEAMACGLAVIATDVGAINFMVSDDNGWLLDSPHPQKIAKALVNAIEISTDVFNRKKEKSLAFAKTDLVWERIIDLLLDKLNTVIQRSKIE